MAGVPTTEATRRSLTPHQAEVVQLLVDSATAEVEANGYEGMSMRTVARRAGVAPATAYTYFSSKEHLLAELLWRRIRTLPVPTAASGGTAGGRLTRTVRELGMFTDESPELAAACTVALLASSPDVKHLRDRIGAEIHRRMSAALGDDADPTVVRVLETAYVGALLTAGMGHLTYAEVPGLVAEAARLMTRPTTGRTP